MGKILKLILLLIVIGAIVFGVTIYINKNKEVFSWKEYGVLPSGYDVKHLFFLDNDTGFLSGIYRDKALNLDKDVLKIRREQDSVIFRTTDGGKKWTNVYKDKGEVELITHWGKGNYAIKNRYYGEKSELQSYLLKSTDNGATWMEKGEIPIYAFYGGGCCSNIIVLWGSHKNKEKQPCGRAVVLSTDDGKSWEQVAFVNTLNSSVEPVLNKDGLFFYVSSTNRLINKNLITGSENLEKEFAGKKISLMSIDQNQDFWLVEKDGDSLRFHKRENDGSFSVYANTLLEKDFSPKYLHVADSTLILWGMRISESSFFPFWYMHRSDDSGKTWKKEEPPFTMQAEPVAFWGKDNIWAMGLGGEIQIRTKRVEATP